MRELLHEQVLERVRDLFGRPMCHRCVLAGNRRLRQGPEERLRSAPRRGEHVRELLDELRGDRHSDMQSNGMHRRVRRADDTLREYVVSSTLHFDPCMRRVRCGVVWIAERGIGHVRCGNMHRHVRDRSASVQWQMLSRRRPQPLRQCLRCLCVVRCWKSPEVRCRRLRVCVCSRLHRLRRLRRMPRSREGDCVLWSLRQPVCERADVRGGNVRCDDDDETAHGARIAR